MRGWIAAAAAIAIVAAAGWIALFVGATRLIRRSSGRTEQHRQEMKQEFDHLEQLPGATLVRRSDFFKLGQGLAGATYTTTSPYVAIRLHYDRVTTQNGWSVVCEHRLRDWGRDFGGRTR
jgi:hypothetical protein